jgi:preprotein translocase subunit SecF
MNIMKRRMWYFLVAGIIAVVCIISLATVGIKTGVEFSSGSILTIGFDKEVNQNALTQELANLGYTDVIIQQTGEGDYIIRTPELNETSKAQLVTGLTAGLGSLSVKEFDSVSSMIASETTRNASIAVTVAVIAMLLYIAWAFRKMPSPFRFGACAVIGLAFDLLVALGVFSILGAIRSWQIDLMFIAGILAILGYSINNTVIIFDRMRENTARGISPDIEVVANASIVQTLGRSFNSSLTTLITLFVLAFFVGASIQNFVIVLIIGIISGALTSTFLSPELLVSWQKKSLGRSKSNLSPASAKG